MIARSTTKVLPETVGPCEVSQENARAKWAHRNPSLGRHKAPGALNMNLAIWALAMFAVNEGHQPIRGWSETSPLNVWWRDQKDSTGSTTTYTISQVTL